MSIKFGESVIGEIFIWQSQALPHRVIVYEIILAGFKFGDFSQNCQFTKLKTLPKFPHYTVVAVINVPYSLSIETHFNALL